MPEIQPVHSRQELMDQTIRDYTRKGFRLVNAYGWTATMERGHKVNHLLHFLIGFFTFATWWLVWIFLAVSNRHQVVTITVDEWLNVNVQKA